MRDLLVRSFVARTRAVASGTRDGALLPCSAHRSEIDFYLSATPELQNFDHLMTTVRHRKNDLRPLQPFPD